MLAINVLIGGIPFGIRYTNKNSGDAIQLH